MGTTQVEGARRPRVIAFLMGQTFREVRFGAKNHTKQ